MPPKVTTPEEGLTIAQERAAYAGSLQVDRSPKTLEVYLGASLVLLSVGFVVGPVSARLDRQARLTDDQRKARRDAMICYIHGTRDQLLQVLQPVEVVAEGDLRRGQDAAALYSSSRGDTYNELAADKELVEELTTTMPELMERGWGKADGESKERLHNIGHVIRRAMRDQELRVIEGHEPLLATSEQKEAMKAAVDRVIAYIETRARRRSSGAMTALEDDVLQPELRGDMTTVVCLLAVRSRWPWA